MKDDMEPKDYGDDGEMCEAPGPDGAFQGKRLPPDTIPFERRVELQGFAAALALNILKNTRPHERYLLRSMVNDLVDH